MPVASGPILNLSLLPETLFRWQIRSVQDSKADAQRQVKTRVVEHALLTAEQ